jgi:hypothetical protein
LSQLETSFLNLVGFGFTRGYEGVRQLCAYWDECKRNRRLAA